jgi:serpin B
LARYYGPLLQTVDFKHDAKGAVDDINKFVADGTHGHIAKILDSLPTDTVLALVNALFLKASWFTPFDPKTTTTESFTRLDGSKADVKMMHGSTFRSLTGDGWVAGSDRYTGSLLVDFVLPDAGQFDAVGNKLGSVFDDLSQHGSDGGELGLPRFTTRFSTELTPAFTKLGITAPYAGGGLLGIADDDSLAVDKVIHATYLTMNEQGTEAAAATIITAVATSGRAGPPPVPVILDRPFYFRIADSNTGATLFIGQVLDPKAS